MWGGEQGGRGAAEWAVVDNNWEETTARMRKAVSFSSDWDLERVGGEETLLKGYINTASKSLNIKMHY